CEMREIFQLAGRNLKTYLRDRSAVFFSLLSAIIVIVLMLVFLGDMNVDAITSLLEELGIPTSDETKLNAELLVIMWTAGGILCVNGVTVAAIMTSVMINDASCGKLQAFRTAPLSRTKLSLGYILSSWTGSVFICLLTLAAAELFAGINGAALPDFGEQLLLLAMIAINCFAYSGLMYFAGLLIKTTGAWSGFSTLVGTLVGFLGGIYIPIGSLPEGVQTALKCLPVLHGCSMFRNVLTRAALEQTMAEVPEDIVGEYREVMGITTAFGDTEIGWEIQLAILAVCGIIFIAVGTLVSTRRYDSDR
ncbi:MAG: ABC transporter permease, partial [Oscillospiraceae bacterium]